MGMMYLTSGDKSNLHALQQRFGKRPGDYIVDPYWFRNNRFTNKADIWNPDTKSWRQIKVNEEFDFDDDGNVVRVS